MKKYLLAATLTVLSMLTGCASQSTVRTHDQLPTSSDQTDVQKRAEIRLQLAVGYFEQGQLQVALDEIKQAITVYPDYADAHSVRALIYMNMGENQLAEDSFLQAIKLAPANPDFHNNYGWLLCQTGREAQSIAQFEIAANNRTYQSPAKALSNAGICSLKLKNKTAAEKYFLLSYEYDPGNPIVAGKLAQLYFERSDYNRAQFYVNRISTLEGVPADVLWLAIKIERRLGDKAAETSLATQLRRRYPTSPEFAAYQRGAFNE